MYKPQPAHEMLWRSETTEVADFCYRCSGDDKANPAQRARP